MSGNGPPIITPPRPPQDELRIVVTLANRQLGIDVGNANVRDPAVRQKIFETLQEAAKAFYITEANINREAGAEMPRIVVPDMALKPPH